MPPPKMANDPSEIFDLDSLCDDSRLASIWFRTQTDSTNNVGLDLLSNGTNDFPQLVLTEKQISGRGRGDKHWATSKGALTFSLLLEKIEVPHSLLSLLTGLSVVRTIQQLGKLVPQIKWPNDVMIRGQKVAGILIESNARGVVVGIGINVNNEPTIEHATSLSQVSNKSFPIKEVLQLQIRSFFDVLELAQSQPERLVEQCQSHMCYLEKHLQLEVGSQQIEGKFVGLDLSGGMLLETASGPKRVLSAKNIRPAKEGPTDD